MGGGSDQRVCLTPWRGTAVRHVALPKCGSARLGSPGRTQAATTGQCSCGRGACGMRGDGVALGGEREVKIAIGFGEAPAVRPRETSFVLACWV